LTAFGNANPSRSSPLIYRDLFLGVSPADAKPQSLIYSRIDGVELSLDFYRAKNSKPAPVVVAIHGGSWHGGDNKTFAPMDHYLAGCGFAVADIIYRLAPQWKFPAALDDTRAAIAFLRQEAGALGIDPNRIVLLGRSAGGQIALAVAYSTKDPGIRGVISFYAPTDLYRSWEHPGNPLVIDTRAALREYLDGSPSEVPSNYAAASPTRLVSSSSPPTLLLHGGRDAVISAYQSKDLTERLREARVPHLNLSIPWGTHGFDYILRGPGGQFSIYAIEYFLKAVAL
jgi:acetyl esterase/lipase